MGIVGVGCASVGGGGFGAGVGVVRDLGSGLLSGVLAVGGVAAVAMSAVPAGSAGAMNCPTARKLVWLEKSFPGGWVVVVPMGWFGVGGRGVGSKRDWVSGACAVGFLMAYLVVVATGCLHHISIALRIAVADIRFTRDRGVLAQAWR